MINANARFLGYNGGMKNWSTDEKKLKKNTQKHTIWRLESLINFGLDGKKINRTLLAKNMAKLTIDPAKKRYLLKLLGK